MISRAICASVLVLFGCGDDTVPAEGPMGSGQSASKQIGGQGGELSLEGVTLSIPAGALSSDQVIVITSTTTRPPAQFTHWSSPVYQFEPAGLTFAIPATVRISFSADAGTQSIYWSSANASTFENLGGVATGSVIATAVMHFSQGFVAPSVGSPAVDASPDGPVDAGTPDAPVDAAVDAAITDALASGDATSCASIGQSCGSPTQCCSLSCVGGFCTTGSSCTPAGQSCSSGAECCSGNCAGSQCASCPANQTLCTGSCVDLSTDPRNCGTCGHACSSGQLCVTGTCAAGG
jgi:stigma-specific protein Stig1